MSPDSEMVHDPTMRSVGYTPGCTMPPEQTVWSRCDAEALAAAPGPAAARFSAATMSAVRDA
jgi:hypothetical protein